VAQGLATRFAPSFRLVNAHFALGTVGLCGFAAALVLRAGAIRGHFFQPLLLGMVHLCVIGWLLPIAIGALHQLVPVVFEVPVRSERAAWVAFFAYALGAITFIGHIWTFATGLGLVIGAGLLLAAILLYVANLYATLARAAAVPITGVYVIAALFFLVVTAGLGFTLAWNLHAPFLYVDHLHWLRAHAHAGVLGFFGLLIMGVAYRLFEMFLLSHGAPMAAAWVALLATSAALVSVMTNFIFGRAAALAVAGGAGAAIGVAAFVIEVRAIFVRRMRKRTDVAWRHSVASFCYLALAVGIGIALSSGRLGPEAEGRLELAYGFLAIPGFTGSIVVGQLYKIAPFLVWFHRFSRFVGLKKVPAASELLPERPQRIQWALMHAGTAAIAAGILAEKAPLRTAGAVAFAASAALFTRNLVVIYRSRP
jgi:hypothetical protein